MPVALKVYTPEKLVLSDVADKVVLPVQEGTLTIIHDRAPRLQILTAGKILLLNEKNESVKTFLILGGVADIASDVCTLAVQGFEIPSI